MSSATRTIWGLGYATNKGLLAISDSGTKIQIGTVKAGNMDVPDPEEFVSKFMSQLQQGKDIVLTASGPNHTYIAGCSNAGVEVRWVHSGTLAEHMNGHGKGKEAQAMLKLFDGGNDPEKIFYVYQPAEAEIQLLRVRVSEWLGTEKQFVRSSNAFAQHVRAERETFRYFEPDRDEWIASRVKTERRKRLAMMRKLGIKLTVAQNRALNNALTAQAEKLYEFYFNPDVADAKKTAEAIVHERMEMFGVEDLYAATEKEAKDLVKDMPHYALFDDLINPGAFRSMTQMLAYTKNPLLYPTVMHLLSFAGIGNLVKGQSWQRRRGEPHRGSPAFRKALCFDLAGKGWQNDVTESRICTRIYYAYKAQQYQKFWLLMQITDDVFKALGKSIDDADESAQFGCTDEEKAASNEVIVADDDFVRKTVRRIRNLKHIPMIGHNKKLLEWLDTLEETPDVDRLWWLFKRGDVPGKGIGLNIQMTPTRIEAQCKRMIATVVLRTLYYRWLQRLDARLPMTKQEDPFYYKMHCKVNQTEVGPLDHRPDVYILYFQIKAAEFHRGHMRDGNAIPLETRAKFVPPKEREAFLARGDQHVPAQQPREIEAA